MSGSPDNKPVSLRLWRITFVAYALALFTATHWPDFRLERGPVPRPDLLLHAGAFAALTVLLILTRWTGRGNKGIATAAGLALVYAAVDELTQAIPVLGRFAALDDFLADALGVFIASAGALLLTRMRPG